MSCQLSVLSKCEDISSVKKYFFPESRDSTPDLGQGNEPGEGDESWDAEWEWNEDGQAVGGVTESVDTTDQPDNVKKKWFQECILSLSPTNDMMAIAHEDKIVVLSQKWDPKNKGEDFESKYSITWQNSLKHEDSEKITALMCLPLASQKRSTQGGPDWTCVMVGFSSGYVRMYTETGVLLLSQLLHSEVVQKLKCRTYEPPRFLGMSEQHEELVILYKRAVVSIDGFSLFQSLRACRNQVARATASGTESMLQPPPLAYKKWGLNDQDKIQDLVSCGIQSANPFDQMKAASLLGGFSATVKTTPPAASVYLTAGVGPYVGFFYAMEGSTQPILSDVAMAVANKIKTALMSAASGWLGFGGKPKEDARDKSMPKIEPATSLPFRYGLADQRRVGDSIVLSPNNKYAALTDGFGRVTLMDIEKGVAIRMWKGYREAQVGWIQVREDEGTSRNRDYSRVAQFLVIYAPRRGILEVWTAANGPRVAAFNVSKWCHLVSPGYGMMGLNNVTSRGVKSRAFQCALVDPEGAVKTLEVPFHLALSDKSSKRARDLHLLKKLKALLKENTDESESLEASIKELLLDMKLSNITKQAVERVLSTRYLSPNCMKNILRVCIQKISGKAETTLDIDSKLFLRFCQTQDGLLHTYKMVEKFTENSSTPDTLASEGCIELVAKTLGLMRSEAEGIVSQLERFSSLSDPRENRVKFKEEKIGVTTYLHCFTCHLHCGGDQESSKPTAISVHKGLSEDRRLALAHYFFHACLLGEASAGDVGIVLQDSNLPADQIMDLLLLYWMSTDEKSVTSLPDLFYLIKTITAMTDKSEVLVDHNIVSPWWQKVRDACSQSRNIRAVYILALAARAVAMEIFGSQTKAKDPDADTASLSSDKTDMSEWESLAVDVEHWNLLIKQLEDVLSLSYLIHLSLPGPGRVSEGVPVLDPISLSVNKLMEGGRGSISEVVAQYIMRLQLSPQSLYRHLLSSSTESDEGAAETAVEAQEEEHTQSPLERIQDELAALRLRFPHSLENDILLSNCCWEYAVHWNKDPELVSFLQLSLEYLKLVQNAVLRQGLSSMMWHMYVVKRMSAAASLMEKVGKSPKERLCRKDVGMSDTTMTVFFECVADLLQIAMDANCEANEVPVFNLEQLWQQIRGPASLVELAVDQKVTNYHLVRHHFLLANIMHAVMLFNMKSVKVLSLYDNKGRNSFFKDLYSHPLLPNQNVELALSLTRRQFLTKLISEAVKTLDTSTEDAGASPRKLNKKFAARWPLVALDLGQEFGVDLDLLKRHHVCELYSGAWDKMAEEVLLTVDDHELMGSELLMVAGKRVAYFLFKSDTEDVTKIMSDMSTTLSTWLKQLDPDELTNPKAPMSDTVVLLQHVANQLPEGISDYNLAISLVELAQSLVET